MIAVCLTTYNHAAFIARAIESVLAQQCEEPFRLYIGDDASSDNTGAICARYAQADERIIYVRREQNRGLVPNTIDLYRRMMADGCTAIAMLDGDDYWTNPHKLQLQIDYLHAHPEVGFVHTAAWDEVEGQIVDTDNPDKPTGDLSTCYDLLGARHTNCTVLFRASLLQEKDLQDILSQSFPVLDYPLYGLFAQYTHFGYIHTYTAVWQNHSSVSHPRKIGQWHRYLTQRIRIWGWLDKRCHGHFHFRWSKAILWYIRQFFYFLFAYLKKKV